MNAHSYFSILILFYPYFCRAICLQAHNHQSCDAMNKPVYFLFVIIFSVLQSCKPTAQEDKDTASPFNRDSLVQHIIVLASDSFQGRKPFSLGETRTVDYMQNKFRALALEPANGTSYLQDVPMVEISLDADSLMKVEFAKGNFQLRRSKDYVLSTENTDSLVSLSGDELIFAGYGVVAPEYHWNDYAGINVKGKVVLVMVNDPGFGTADTSIFKGKTMTYYGRWTYKYEEAARQGAKACLIIHNTGAASYPFSVVQSSNGGVKLHLDTRSSPRYQLVMQGWITGETAGKMLAAAGKDSSLLQQAQQRGFKALPLNIKVTA